MPGMQGLNGNLTHLPHAFETIESNFTIAIQSHIVPVSMDYIAGLINNLSICNIVADFVGANAPPAPPPPPTSTAHEW